MSIVPWFFRVFARYKLAESATFNNSSFFFFSFFFLFFFSLFLFSFLSSSLPFLLLPSSCPASKSDFFGPQFVTFCLAFFSVQSQFLRPSQGGYPFGSSFPFFPSFFLMFFFVFFSCFSFFQFLFFFFSSQQFVSVCARQEVTDLVVR